MKKNKGFTLIELLAVIVILAIIALIAVPVILNIVEKARKSAFTDTAYGIVNAGELYFAEQQLDLNGMEADKEFSLPTQANTIGGLQIKGEVPEGKVQITKSGELALLVKNERYCVTKGYNDTEVTLSEDLEHCYMPHTLAALSVEEVECATDKTEDACDPGTSFTLKVNKNETNNFYVLKDEGNKVTLIMNENLGQSVAWYADAQDNSYGPITAINYLDDLTDDEWNNIPKRNYIYSGIAEDGRTRKYEDITRNMRARMISHGEVTAIITANDGQIPTYVYGGRNYWTSTAVSSYPGGAWHMTYFGELYGSDVDYGSNDSLRPVIELLKNAPIY